MSMILLVAATGLAIAGVALLGGFPTWRSFWMTIVPVAVIEAATFALLSLFRPRRNREAPRQRRELWDWLRARTALYIQPLILTALALFCLAPAHILPSGRFSWVQPYILVLFPLSVVSTFNQILPWWPRRLMTAAQREYVEELGDELSRQHAGVAFRWGATAFLVGLGAVLLASLYAPQWVRPTAVAAIWLGAVATSIRFGLLQRAAEGGEA
jgi:hypothetical protein